MRFVVSILFFMFGSAAWAEDRYLLNVPIGWGDHSKSEICDVMNVKYEAKCLVFAKNTDVKSVVTHTYLQVDGAAAEIQQLLGTDFAPFPLVVQKNELSDLFEGRVSSVAILPNRCAVAKVKPGCRCIDNGLTFRIECDGQDPIVPVIPDLGVDLKDLLPKLPQNGSIIKLRSTQNFLDQTQKFSSWRRDDACGGFIVGCTCMGSHYVCEDGSTRLIP